MPRSDFRVVGAEKLERVGRQLKNADKTVRNSMRKRIRSAAGPVVDEAKRNAGEVSASVAKSIVLEMRYSGPRAGAYIKAKRARMPAGKAALPGLLELGSQGSGGRYIRHPVFARRGRADAVYVNQPTHPFLKPAVDKHVHDIRKELIRILDDVERDLRA